MLYKPQSINLDEDLIYFTHIPKCGGISLFSALKDAIPPYRTIALRNGPMYHIMGMQAQRSESLRHWWLNLRDDTIHALRRLGGLPGNSVRAAAFVHGHRPVYHAPSRRKVHQIFTVRDPVERVFSFYNYDRHLSHSGRTSSAVGNMAPRLYPSFEEYATMLLREKDNVQLNRQLLFLSPNADLGEAMQFVQRKTFLAAPTHEIPRFLKLMGLALNREIKTTGKLNEGARATAVSQLDGNLFKALSDAMSADRQLVECVSRAFAQVLERSDGVA